MTAFSCGLSFSMRAMAASTSSMGVADPARTRSACAVASKDARSSVIDPNRSHRTRLAEEAGHPDPETEHADLEARAARAVHRAGLGLRKPEEAPLAEPVLG